MSKLFNTHSGVILANELLSVEYKVFHIRKIFPSVFLICAYLSSLFPFIYLYLSTSVLIAIDVGVGG